MHTHQFAIFALAGAVIPASACSRADTAQTPVAPLPGCAWLPRAPAIG